MSSNLFTDLTPAQQETVLGGSSLANVANLVTQYAPGVKLPPLVTSPNFGSDLSAAIRGEISGGLP
jgi:hypothetical protein